MTRFLAGMALAGILTLPVPAAANFNFFSRPAPVRAYYYPAPAVYTPIYFVPSAPVRAPVVAPAPVFPIYANPTPAPPSLSCEPPLAPPAVPPMPPMPPMPPASFGSVSMTRESHYHEAYTSAAGDASRQTADRASVAFWNLSAADLTIRINGQVRYLPHGRSMILDLDRQFVWQVEGRESQAERVPAGESALDILIRR